MKSRITLFTLIISTLSFPFAASAENKEAIDNVVVVGEKSIADLRRDVFEAEEDFYATFNKLNDVPEFDVRCFYEKPTGTRIKNHVCRAKFVSKAYSSHAARNGNDLSRVANQDANSALSIKTAQYQEKMETLVEANPELLAALVRYNTARERFFAEREENSSN